jgi:carbon-monoxide dehydrogenase iron sulfur subunit
VVKKEYTHNEEETMEVIMVDQEKCTGCHQCELWCGNEIASVSKELPLAINEDPQPVPRVHVEGKRFALQCRHCPDAPCITACPNGTMRRDPESGLVFVYEPTCIACWMCVMVCPFGIINPSSSLKVAVKCDRCRNMEFPICVEVCPTNALKLVDRKEATEIKP